MSKTRRIEITIETHEISRIHRTSRPWGDDHTTADLAQRMENQPTGVKTSVPDLLLFSEGEDSEEGCAEKMPSGDVETSHSPDKFNKR